MADNPVDWRNLSRAEFDAVEAQLFQHIKLGEDEARLQYAQQAPGAAPVADEPPSNDPIDWASLTPAEFAAKEAQMLRRVQRDDDEARIRAKTPRPMSATEAAQADAAGVAYRRTYDNARLKAQDDETLARLDRRGRDQ